MPARRILSLLAFAAVLGAAIAGCKAGRGDPCKEPNDCSGNLMCCKATPSATARGVCQPTCEDMMDDAGPMDSGSEDAGMDAGEQDAGDEDAGPQDAGTDGSADEDAGTDAGPEDAGTDGSAEDAGTDAGPVDAGPDA